ncbi:MAG TPA: STAS domain-containing protein [Acidimicrobiia bacterium]
MNRRRTSASWQCPRPSRFAILVVHEPHDVVLQLSGELDLGGAEALDACVVAVLSDQPRRLVLELSALTFVDIVGSRCFDESRLRAEAADVQLILDSPSHAVRQVLELRGQLDAFRIR